LLLYNSIILKKKRGQKMKKIIFIGIALLALTGCGSKKAESSAETKESTTSTSTTVKSSSITQTTKSTTTSTTQQAAALQQPAGSLNDFVGGWGVPQSDNLFFINADNTLTGSDGTISALGNVSYTQDDAGNLVMTSDLGVLTKNADGTVTVNNQNYQYLGNTSMDQYIAQNNAQSEQTNANVAEASAPEETPVYDTLREGEGIAQLAQRNGITLDQFFKLNPGKSLTSGYVVGESLRVK
jgi:flagellum-specific peptidoglycan hydrolase FlgJ